jgi:hypothetical protein
MPVAWRRLGLVAAPPLLLALAALAACSSSPRSKAACSTWEHQTVRATGGYVPAAEAYSRPYVFAFTLDCNGIQELVTVQRPTGNLPVCQAGQQVEVTGRLILNRSLVDPHYEINDPSSVICK